MICARHGLSPRMLALTRRYATYPNLRRREAAIQKYNNMWDAVMEFQAAGPTATHGRSRRDETRP